MRTTLSINTALMRQVKKSAAERKITMGQLFEAALRNYLAAGKSPKSAHRFRWRTEKGKIMPGVTLDDRDALLDLMEGKR